MSHEVPEVITLVGGEIVLDLSPDQAATLARVLAHYDVLVTSPLDIGPVPGYRSEVWHHTLLRLRTEALRQCGEHADLAEVTMLPRRLVALAGGAL